MDDPTTIGRASERPGRGRPGREPGQDRITFVGHATVLIELGGVRLLTDPMLRRRGLLLALSRHGRPPAPEASADLDAVLVSHPHQDHLDLRSLRGLDPDVRALVGAGSGELVRSAGLEDVVELRPGDRAAVGPVEVTVVRAAHDGRRHPARRPAEAVGFVVEGERRVYFAGDTKLFCGMAELAGGLEVALLPVWGWGPRLGPGHLDPRTAARAAAILRPRIAVPIHWGTLFPRGLALTHGRFLREPPRAFARHVAELAPGVEVRVLEPGESLELG